MSFNRGWSAINLEMTERIPHTEFIDHDEFIKEITGISTDSKIDANIISAKLAEKLDYDYIWSIFEMPITKGRITKLGHAVWNSIDVQDNETYCPFESEDEVLSFNPVEEYGIPDINQTVTIFKDHYTQGQFGLFKDAVFPGGRYNSLFSACIRTFGWELLLTSVAIDSKKFDRVLEGFFEITKAEIEAWIKAGIKVYNIHDDICWTSGPVMHPSWYREYIFPRYKRLWDPLKEAGIKIIYTSDGTYTEFFDDIIAAGADGLVMEPSSSMEFAVEKYGQSKILIGNMDCRILQYGSKEDIFNEVKRCSELGKNCPGYFFNVSNHIPNGIPIENIYYYFHCCEKLGKR